jgi:hypothetical protein
VRAEQKDAGAPSVSIAADAALDTGAAMVQDAGPSAGAGWDLDPQDPARDYVRRYIRATQRYADKTDCVLVGKSGDKNGKRAVEVRATPPCGTSNAVRDVFYVDVAGDRLTTDDPATRAPLQPWPDGSLPDKPAAPVVVNGSMREWRTPMADALEKLLVSPMSVHFYGRGTYLLVTLTGWRKPIAHEASYDQMRDSGRKLCLANKGNDFALREAAVPGVWLRFKCPDGTFKWDTHW